MKGKRRGDRGAENRFEGREEGRRRVGLRQGGWGQRGSWTIGDMLVVVLTGATKGRRRNAMRGDQRGINVPGRNPT